MHNPAMDYIPFDQWFQTVIAHNAGAAGAAQGPKDHVESFRHTLFSNVPAPDSLAPGAALQKATWVRNYMCDRFQAEERVMETARYPNAYPHSVEHEGMKRALERLLVENQSSDRQLLNVFRLFLQHFALHHVSRMDTPMIGWLRENSVTDLSAVRG